MWTVNIDEGANYPVPGAASGTARVEMSQIQVPALEEFTVLGTTSWPFNYRRFIVWMEGSWGALILT